MMKTLVSTTFLAISLGFAALGCGGESDAPLEGSGGEDAAAEADRSDGPAEDVREAGADSGLDVGSDSVGDVTLDAGTDAQEDVSGGEAGLDAGPEAPFDAGDATLDASADAELDAGADAPIDAELDVATDVGPDVVLDAGVDVGVDAGPAQPSFTQTDIDFGRTGCGRVAAPRSFYLSNIGGAPFAFDVGLKRGAASPFAVSPTSGSLAPGASVKLVLTPAAVPAPASFAKDAYGDTLLVTTDIAGDLPHLVPLHQSAYGAIVRVDAPSLSAGDVPLGKSTSGALVVRNAGNGPATVTLSTTGSAFAVAPASPTLVAGGDVLSSTVTFSPTTAGASAGALRVVTDGADPLCEPLPADVALSGTGTNGAVALSATSIDFGRVDCGSTASAKTFDVANTGNGTFHFDAALSAGASSPFVLAPTSGTVAPGAKVIVTVTPSPVPQSSSTADDLYADTIELTTDVVADSPHTLRLHETAQGAILALSPTAIDFGDVPANTTVATDLVVSNSGNAPADVTWSTAAGRFYFGARGPDAVAAGGSATRGVLFSPLAVASYAGEATIDVAPGAVLCAPLPAAVPLAGAGTNGSIVVSPAALDFGAVDCGSGAAPASFTVSNLGDAPFDYSTSLGTAFYVLDPAAGTVPAKGFVTVTVTPAPIPATSDVTPDLYGDTVTITTSVTGDTPHAVALHETAHGAILSTSVTSLAFGGVGLGSSSNFELTLSNAGNAPANVSFSTANPVFEFSPTGVTVGAGSSALPNVVFTPKAVATYADDGAIAVTATPLCAALPSALALTGTGTSGGVKIGDTNLSFGFVDCGTSTGSLTTTVTNLTGAPITFSTSLGKASPFFTVSPPSGTIASLATVTLAVAPKAVPSTSVVTPDFYGDVLTVSTSAAGDVPHQVSLHLTARGAILSFSKSQIAFPITLVGQTSTRNGDFLLSNAGNVDAPFAFTLSNAADFAVAPASGTATAGVPFAARASFVPKTRLSNRTGTLGVTTTVVRCAPLPTSVALSGFAL